MSLIDILNVYDVTVYWCTQKYCVSECAKCGVCVQCALSLCSVECALQRCASNHIFLSFLYLSPRKCSKVLYLAKMILVDPKCENNLSKYFFFFASYMYSYRFSNFTIEIFVLLISLLPFCIGLSNSFFFAF